MLKIFRGRRITKRLRLSRLGCFVRELPVMTSRVFSVGLSSADTRHNVTYPGADDGEDGKSLGMDQSVAFLSSLS